VREFGRLGVWAFGGNRGGGADSVARMLFT